MTYSGSGAGTEGDPYIITTPDQLNEVRDFLSAWWELGNNIDMNVAPYNSGTGFEPISTFTGKFHGRGYTISNLFINRPSEEEVGLFGRISGSTAWVRDFKVTGNVTGEKDVGGVVGYIANNAKIKNCGFEGNVVGTDTNSPVGGFVGVIFGGFVNNCYSKGTVEGEEYFTGGFCGIMFGSPIRVYNCYTHSDVISSISPCGFSWGTPTLSCYSIGTPTGSNPMAFTWPGAQLDPVTHYWDMETSGLTTGFSAKGRLTSAMQRKDNYEGWSFGNIWDIDEGNDYPELLWQPVTCVIDTISSITTSGFNIFFLQNTSDIIMTAEENGLVYGKESFENPKNTAPNLTDYENYISTTSTNWASTKSVSNLKEGMNYFVRAYFKIEGVYCYSDEVKITTLTNDSSLVLKNDFNDNEGLTNPGIQIRFA